MSFFKKIPPFLFALIIAVTTCMSYVSAVDIKLTKTTLSLEVGESVQLYITYAYDTITWSTSDKNIASVNKGKVTAVKPGTATVTAKHAGSVMKCKVTVSAKGEVSKNKKYLFDTAPYLVENVWLFARNNDRDTVYDGSTGTWKWWYNDTDLPMRSGGEEYKKGLSIYPKSGEKARLYYNLKKQYTKLTGQVAFDDRYSDKQDDSITIRFYGDDKLLKTVTVKKGDLPKNISVNLNKCNKLVIELEGKSGKKDIYNDTNLLNFIVSD